MMIIILLLLTNSWQKQLEQFYKKKSTGSPAQKMNDHGFRGGVVKNGLQLDTGTAQGRT